ncbi:hypothetical protein [Brucella pseudogrignonensis]|uniref:Aldose 1-epimerase n=1 Tax=Brucella pseudogrignonensis TaxID=419475 RepID=A0ABU1MD18_9HYPH|nr:hypothetical protein [Brucella pseudogrignonensis]MDR6433666.1 aldose 1-epimerase [Brucella pseudogrignonensis]
MVIELAAYDYRLKVDPKHGATILSVEWQHPDGDQVPLLLSLDQPEAGLKAGCFVMAPFANRIDGGKFVLNDRPIQLPVNAPDEAMAIHGFSRDRQWQCASVRDDRVLMTDIVAGSQHPYSYHLGQQISILPEGIRVSLSIRNESLLRLPFGLGLHPWFEKTPGATLEFSSGGAPRSDTRGLPEGCAVLMAGFEPGCPTRLSVLPLINSCFSGWNSCEALIKWPERSTALMLRAEGALKHLHVFNPQDRAVFCAEPVSHLPDAVNRPALGKDAAMTILSPGESLSGSAFFSAFALQNSTVEPFSGRT